MANLSKGQLQTLINFMEMRQLPYINPDAPPCETCKYIRSKPRLGWCTLLRGNCVGATNGCLRQWIREEKPLYTEKDRITDLETTVGCLANDCKQLEKEREYNAELCRERDKALALSDKIIRMEYGTAEELHRWEKQYRRLRRMNNGKQTAKARK